MNETLCKRIVNKIDMRSPEDCWEWNAAKDNGYGKIRVAGSTVCAHRVVYELFVEPIPEGLQLDHLCRNPSCVNPDHLEPVTNRENAMRGLSPAIVTHRTGVCQRGHSMDDAIDNGNGRRACRSCVNWNRRRRRAERRSNVD